MPAVIQLASSGIPCQERVKKHEKRDAFETTLQRRLDVDVLLVCRGLLLLSQAPVHRPRDRAEGQQVVRRLAPRRGDCPWAATYCAHDAELADLVHPTHDALLSFSKVGRMAAEVGPAVRIEPWDHNICRTFDSPIFNHLVQADEAFGLVWVPGVDAQELATLALRRVKGRHGWRLRRLQKAPAGGKQSGMLEMATAYAQHRSKACNYCIDVKIVEVSLARFIPV